MNGVTLMNNTADKDIYRHFNFYRRRVWGTLSKALLKSRYTTSKLSCSAINTQSVHSSGMTRSWICLAQNHLEHRKNSVPLSCSAPTSIGSVIPSRTLPTTQVLLIMVCNFLVVSFLSYRSLWCTWSVFQVSASCFSASDLIKDQRTLTLSLIKSTLNCVYFVRNCWFCWL